MTTARCDVRVDDYTVHRDGVVINMWDRAGWYNGRGVRGIKEVHVLCNALQRRDCL